MHATRRIAILAAVTLINFAPTACSSSGSGDSATSGSSASATTFTVGGTASGLTGTVVLQNNGADDLTLTANGSFSFATSLASGSAYQVSIKSNPNSQICFFQNASDAGNVASANITSVALNCASSTSTTPAWVQDAYLKASNPGANDNFGLAVAVSGSTVVVGVRNEDSNQTTITNTDSTATADDSAGNSGAAYVFQRDTSGIWVQDAYLKASNAEAGDWFGTAVAISGSTVVVGAIEDDSNQTTITNTDGTASADNSASNAGAVYIFKRETSGNWVQDAYLKASNAEAGDYFGFSVAISGSTVVVGARDEDSNQTTITNTDGSASGVNGTSGSGAVYVFKRDTSGDWVQDAYLKASNAGIGSSFGWAVAISGATVVVTAPSERSNQTTITNADGAASADISASASGAAYIFKREASGDWVQDAYLKASNAEAGDGLGESAAISGSTVVVGARNEDANQTTIDNNDGAASANNSTTGSGAVYVFKREASGDWVQDAFLKASNAEASDSLGYSVAASGSTVVVGAHQEASNQTTITNTDGSASGVNGAASAGAVYIFKLQ
ncbi:hypothetical protein [Turneriella parva]|uniref:Integrin alpha beta-propellor repeat protein n=1 Tax=Turneriella parva (strain ATCC BAA-1111 / DSM 21527 / NCTC 11395 / H) TaxID=869212 RepID=I4B4K0_TURPD|nr:hypothetical protein [Turneriella parva]AFM12207.1 hypothetical protein Turpa_1559 [Turneriella parva DSM 21527]